MKASNYFFLPVAPVDAGSNGNGLFGIVAKGYWKNTARFKKGLHTEDLAPKMLASILPAFLSQQSEFHRYDAVIGVFVCKGRSFNRGRQRLADAGFCELVCDEEKRGKFAGLLSEALDSAGWDAMAEVQTRDPADVVGGSFVKWPG